MKLTDTDYIKEVADILKENGLKRVEIKSGGTRILLEKYSDEADCLTAPKGHGEYTLKQAEKKFDESHNDEEAMKNVKVGLITDVKSPIVGVFYSSSTPEAEPFVNIGDTVKKGDVLCVIEAMKFFNEITAECDGKIVDIFLKSGDVVEFGQILFRIQ